MPLYSSKTVMDKSCQFQDKNTEVMEPQYLKKCIEYKEMITELVVQIWGGIKTAHTTLVF